MIVKGKPFLILPAEINNSSMSCTRYMTECLPKLKAQGLNTILGSVGWNQVEPEEGRFEFLSLRHSIEQARVLDLQLVILWFGSFKTGKWSQRRLVTQLFSRSFDPSSLPQVNPPTRPAGSNAMLNDSLAPS